MGYGELRGAEMWDEAPRLQYCLCCGYQFTGGFGYICEFCFWEDDCEQLHEFSGANQTSLIQAQLSFQSIGACRPDVVMHVRKPGEKDRRDPQWRHTVAIKPVMPE